ncbi:MAG: alpha/beta hydrolase family protein [Sedimentisphaeraceae bacterium JB056]
MCYYKFCLNKKSVFSILAFSMALCSYVFAVDIPWNVTELQNAPEYYIAHEYSKDGVDALFFDGPDYKGSKTQIFAYVGKPSDVTMPAPGVVLVHGGGGTASVEWVKRWTDKGYVAMSIDTTGSIPDGKFPSHKKHQNGGPDGWGGFDQIDEPITDQWTYHAVAAIMLANSLLAEEFDANNHNIGVVGVSWGGYLTSIAASIDNRFSFAVPIYGCGFLHRNSAWSSTVFKSMGKEKTQKWVRLWDPSAYLRRCEIPVLWVSDVNDKFFPMDSLKRSASLVYESQFCIKPDLGHSHAIAFDIEEAYEFAGSVCDGKKSFVTYSDQNINDGVAFAGYWTLVHPEKAVMLYTLDSGPWKDRKWNSIPAEIDKFAENVSAKLPDGTTAYFFNAENERAMVSSSPYMIVPKQEF